MLWTDMQNFFLASVGASASFIGLLFVALTLVTAKPKRTAAGIEHDRNLAVSSYTALINILFISLEGLTPSTDLALVMLIMGSIGLLSTTRSLLALRHATDFVIPRSFALLSLLYAIELGGGVFALAKHEDVSRSFAIIIIFALYSVALARAWALTGLHRLPTESEEK